MKTISTPLADHIAKGQTTLAYLWLVTRKDGTQIGFTSFDEDIAFQGITYLASTGFTNTATENKSDLSVDNLEIAAFISSDSLADEDLRAGVYDGCSIEIRIVNWTDIIAGSIPMRKGTIGAVKMAGGLFTAEIRGLTDKLSTVVGATYGPVCRAIFGSGLNGIDEDSKYLCKVDVVPLREVGSVDTVTDPLTFTPLAGLTATANYFNDGLITFQSGVLEGEMYEIKGWDGTKLSLYLPLRAAPANGDTFTIEPGCNHTTDDCKNKFSNLVNFRGEPFIPGEDSILMYPNATN